MQVQLDLQAQPVLMVLMVHKEFLAQPEPTEQLDHKELKE